MNKPTATPPLDHTAVAAILDRAHAALRSTYPRLALPSDVRDTVSAAIYTIEAFAAERGIKLEGK